MASRYQRHKQDPKCKGCIYLSESVGCCDYIGHTDKRRPCPPGKDCTVKKVSKRSGKRTKKQREKGFAYIESRGG